MKKVLLWWLIFILELVAAIVVSFTARTLIAGRGVPPPGDIRIAGASPAPPRLNFACELNTEQLQSLFSNPQVTDDLTAIHAAVSLSLMDLSAGRASVVRQLNQAGIAVTAWLALPKEQGYYLNAGNVPAARARVDDFEQWTRETGLRWAGVGLDIEPDLREFSAVGQGHFLSVAGALLRRVFDIGRVRRARTEYAALIGRIRRDGYPVETYQFPFLADERKVHSTLLERLTGIVDLRGDREVFMTYSSFNHPVDSALIWEYGPEAQLLAVGSTAGDPDPKFGPLNWDEFSRDLIVASHFSPVVGVYSLEGCVRQGFLPRLRTMNWAQSITIPSDAIRKIVQLRTRIQAGLWTASHLLYFAAAWLLVDAWFISRRRKKEPFRYGW